MWMSEKSEEGGKKISHGIWGLSMIVSESNKLRNACCQLAQSLFLMIVEIVMTILADAYTIHSARSSSGFSISVIKSCMM